MLFKPTEDLDIEAIVNTQRDHIGLEDVQGVPVRVGIDGNRPYVHAAQGANDAASDLASISDENLAEHHRSQINTSSGVGL